MPSNKKLLQAAAGNAGGTEGYVEDVFSTYLYTGTGVPQTIQNGINLGSSLGGPSTNFVSGQKLSRASNLTGNAQTKQMTFSCWVFWEGPNGGMIFYLAGTYVRAEINSDGSLSFLGYAAGAADTLQMQSPAGTIPINSWTSILFSFDLASTSNRYLYINDVAVTPTYTHYVNQLFNNDAASQSGPSPSSSTSYAHLLVDYNYIDLSVTSNRRNFITADLQPAAQATQEALNPIIYLPMTTSTPETNAGTGGDFTATNSPVFNETFGPSDSSEAGKGGLTWIKKRSGTGSNLLFDTDRGFTSSLISDSNAAATISSPALVSDTSTGFSVNVSYPTLNASAATYASWTFRKAEKFFDVVTYTGDGTNTRRVSHNLNATPGFIVVKKTSATQDWICSHSYDNNYNNFKLNTTGTTFGAGYIDTPNETSFGVNDYGNPTALNHSGATYVAYLFASDAGGFGDDGSESIIKCGSYTGNGSATGPVESLGWEPQYVMFKNVTTAGQNWGIHDIMQGMSVTTGVELRANTNDRDFTSTSRLVILNPDGFQIGTADDALNKSGDTYIYIAIRRPMKTPTVGTEVFAPVLGVTAGTTITGFPVDYTIARNPSASQQNFAFTRMLGENYLATQSTAAESATGIGNQFDVQNGIKLSGWFGVNSTVISWNFKRATGFMDVVAYTGDGTTYQTINHNLKAVPQLLICKSRDTSTNWPVVVENHGASTALLSLNTSSSHGGTGTYQNGYLTSSSDSIFYAFYGGGSLPTSATASNASGVDYIAYLFASVAGVSKVGSYTGNGGGQTIDCGFTTGARFILIKRTNAVGNWMLFDSARGIIAGSDPYLELNTTDAEVTFGDYVAPNSAGFNVSSFTNPTENNVNANGDSYIFLAIA